MGIGSLGSVSFWQQDQNYWNQAQQQAQSAAASNALITTMGNLQTNKVRGLASIANELALSRVNAQLQAALQSAPADVTERIEHVRFPNIKCGFSGNRNRNSAADGRHFSADLRNSPDRYGHRE